MVKKCFLFIIILCLSLFLSAIPVSASSYEGYIYDEWGQVVLTPQAYEPESVLTGNMMACGELNNPEDLFVRDNTVYLADTGNNRIVILDRNMKTIDIMEQFTGSDGEAISLKAPGGIFVDSENTLYIADTENGRIIIANREGELLQILDKPELPLENTTYMPQRICVDRNKNIYVKAKNIYQGLVMLDKNGKFKCFFGSNTIELTPKVLGQMFWKNFMTYEQRKALFSDVPIEYSNVYINRDDFIYTTVSYTETSKGEIKKLNYKGNNILVTNMITSGSVVADDYGDHPIYYNPLGKKTDSSFVDICVAEDERILALDTTRGRVFTYDQDSNLLYTFGGIGDAKGLFKVAVSLEVLGDKVLVLDSAAKSITVFRITDFAVKINKALTLYRQGFYHEAAKHWDEVLQMSSQYNLAYVGLGKSALRLKNYAEAMTYFKQGYDKQGYSDAQKMHLMETLKENIILTAAGAVLLLVSPFALPWLVKKARKRISTKK